MDSLFTIDGLNDLGDPPFNPVFNPFSVPLDLHLVSNKPNAFIQNITGKAKPKTVSPFGIVPFKVSSAFKPAAKVTTVGQYKGSPEVPKGSKVSYKATFVSKDYLSFFNLALPGYKMISELWTRNTVATSRDKFRDALENSGQFVDINPTASMAGGGIEIRFVTTTNWNTIQELRNYIKGLISKVATPEGNTLNILVLGKTDAPVVDTPNDNGKGAVSRNKEISESVTGIAGNLIKDVSGGLGGLLTNSGYLLPAAALGIVLIAVFTVKK
jgi:hypothetical protein